MECWMQVFHIARAACARSAQWQWKMCRDGCLGAGCHHRHVLLIIYFVFSPTFLSASTLVSVDSKMIRRRVENCMWLSKLNNIVAIRHNLESPNRHRCGVRSRTTTLLMVVSVFPWTLSPRLCMNAARGNKPTNLFVVNFMIMFFSYGCGWIDWISTTGLLVLYAHTAHHHNITYAQYERCLV